MARPKIKTGYPVTIHGQTFTRVGIVCALPDYHDHGLLDVIYVDATFRARRTSVVWRKNRFEWADPGNPGILAEDDPALKPFVVTVKNGRY